MPCPPKPFSTSATSIYIFASLASRPTAAGVAALMSDPMAATISWAHFLTIDLFIGRWIYLDSRERGLTALLLITLPLFTACAPRPQPTVPAPPEAMVIVPAGWFLMGQNDGRRSNQPQHQVYLDAFAIDRTEVTNAAFAEFVAQANFQPKQGWDQAIVRDHANEPVVGVLWAEADAYCRWAGKRLPSEAEWEKAARGTDGRLYPWGNTWDSAKANTLESGRGGVMPVGSFADGASPYGVLDVAGNAAEWVADYFDFDYYTYAPDHNPPGPNKVMDHGLRGGSWASPQEQAQTFFRDSSHSVDPNDRVGFRCAQTWAEGTGLRPFYNRIAAP